MTKTGQYQRRISAIHWLETSGALALVMFMLTVLGSTPAQAQTYTYIVLHKFTGGADGGGPLGSLIRDSAGNFYGTTSGGGGDLSVCGGYGCGVVYKLDTSRNETVLYSFTGGADGSGPDAGLVRDAAGNLYGTTRYGGLGFGVVFKVDTTGTETVLYSFTGGADGQQPVAGVIRDSAGNLYGTTAYGGTQFGVVFKLDTTGKQTVLYGFTGNADGANPFAGVIRDSAGNLYGTTYNGGTSNAGVVFKLDTTGKETVLYNFTGGADGANPAAGLIRDSAGNLYGTTDVGGIAAGVCSGTFGTPGCGVVFKLDTTGKETVLYSFTGGADGAIPSSGVIRDSAGNLYGTTLCGGTGTSPRPCPAGAGVVYKLDTTGTETVLHSFSGGKGTRPQGGLIRDSAGNLFGTTPELGQSSNSGVVFKLKP